MWIDYNAGQFAFDKDASFIYLLLDPAVSGNNQPMDSAYMISVTMILSAILSKAQSPSSL
jgi:hypothetical protein